MSGQAATVRAFEQLFEPPVPQDRRGGGRLRSMGRSPKRFDALTMAFSAWMADRSPPLSRNTRRVYKARVTKANRLALEGDRSLLADDSRTVRFVLGKLSPTPSNQRGYLAALTHFFDFLVEQGLRKDNPAADLGRPPPQVYIPRPLDKAACAEYLRAAKRLGVAHYTLAVLGLYQGLRCAEIAGLAWAQLFHAEGRDWLDVGGKGPMKKRIGVKSKVSLALRKARASHNNAHWVFPSPYMPGAPISTKTARTMHRQILAAAGLPETHTLHQLRHSFGTHLRRIAKADQGLVQRGLRHVSPASTQIYMEVLDDEVADKIEELDYGEDESALAPPGEN
jgi:integrase/recombinase XerD